MRPELLALYAGPDQIMGVASGIATIVGIALMLWNKLLVTFGKIANRFRPEPHPEEPHPEEPPQGTQ